MAVLANKVICLKGTHGTSKTRAKSILDNKSFEASDKGLIGSGVYFWSYSTDISYAKRLAENWWRFSNEKSGTYKNDDDPSLEVLKADINIDESLYFDVGSESFCELLVKTAESRSIPSTKEEFLNLRAVLVKEIEALNGVPYWVIKASVDVPGKIGRSDAPYVYWVKKQAESYVVMPHALGAICNIEKVEV